MRMKLVCSLFAVLAVAACETAPDDKSAAMGSGSATQAATAPTTRPSTTVASREMGSMPKSGSQEDLVVNVGDRVFFDFDKYDLRSESRTTLEKQAAWLERNPQVRVAIEGHTDERGTREYNLALGERRSASIRDYLIALGVDANRMAITSFGKERPVDTRSSKEAWSVNRRGVMVVK